MSRIEPLWRTVMEDQIYVAERALTRLITDQLYQRDNERSQIIAELRYVTLRAKSILNMPTDEHPAPEN